MSVVLSVRGLETRFKVRKGYVYAVNNVSFQVEKGEIVGVVGESGSGKSVTMLSLIKLLPPAAQITAGQVLMGGRDILTLKGRDLRKVRGGKIGIIFQDPMTSLNPVVKIGVQLTEGLIHHRKISRGEAQRRAADLLHTVGIADAPARLHNYPHELSGGMRQRVMIALALACEPEVIIADEPTTALDVTIQAQIVELMKSLRTKLSTAFIWVTHDLSLIAGLADRVLVMYGGTIVEEAPVDDLYTRPRHPYTLGLLNAVPKVRGETTGRLASIEGTPPVLNAPPARCPFVNRCKFAFARCHTERPQLRAVLGSAPTHRIACHLDLTPADALSGLAGLAGLTEGIVQ